LKVIVGLGNPGRNYHETRHNVGFRVIQRLAERHRVDVRHQVMSAGRPAGVYGEYQDGGDTVRLLMPLTMMNESGEALRELPVPLGSLLIVCDDVNLPLGTIRLRAEGGAGGHNGLASCLEMLATEAVPRLRVGVGGAKLPADLTDFVLSPVPSAERPALERAMAQAVEACEAWSAAGIEAAMSKYNKPA
jgi:PTH1 family peptidyl-tRNA hydrolase